MRRGLSLIAAALLCAHLAPLQAKADQPEAYAFEDKALDRLAWPQLTRFTSDADFHRYLDRLDTYERKKRRAVLGLPVVAASSMDQPETAQEQECDPASGDCLESGAENIVVTGSRVSKPASITNVQTAGVDEGDIVKQIGNYLITLQDGRLFVVDIKGKHLTDRFDVYRKDEDGDPVGADWYDEMLVRDDHILVAAYSYTDSATELSVFRLDQANGKIARVGVFLISSDDYYDVDNYATRIIGDRLVIYTPYDADQLEDAEGRPVIRRWLPPGERATRQKDGKPMFAARDIYRPVMRTGEPEIHTVSVCPLGPVSQGAQLDCRTTAFVGPQHAEMFVSPEAVYLWTSTRGEDWGWRIRKPDCTAADYSEAAQRKDVLPAAVYRIPMNGSGLSVVAANGYVFDQFSMDEYKGQFRALVDWTSFRCDPDYDRSRARNVALFDFPLDQFGDFYDSANPARAASLPASVGWQVENRFADDWLVYGGRVRWAGYPPDGERPDYSTSATAVPLGNVKRLQQLPIGHSVLRLERVGADRMIATGYHDDTGLEITMLSLGKTAAQTGRAYLKNRFESEGRSHAFNSTVFADGSGLMGLPTVLREDEAGRWWWRSSSSDLSFIAMDRTGGLTEAGALIALPAEKVQVADGYECEVSCIDWYGNSRPIFTEDRIFGLLGTQLVEGKLASSKVAETGRLDLTATIGSTGTGTLAGQ